jgi:hypothetical protein
MKAKGENKGEEPLIYTMAGLLCSEGRWQRDKSREERGTEKLHLGPREYLFFGQANFAKSDYLGRIG